jgi:hypothetical protein
MWVDYAKVLIGREEYGLSGMFLTVPNLTVSKITSVLLKRITKEWEYQNKT